MEVVDYLTCLEQNNLTLDYLEVSGIYVWVYHLFEYSVKQHITCGDMYLQKRSKNTSRYCEFCRQGGVTTFENVAQFRYFGTTVTNQNLIQEEITRRLNSGNACYHSVQNLLSSCLLSKNIKIRIYKSIILLVVLYGCETWSLTLREEHRLRVFEKRVLRRIFDPKRDEVTGDSRKLHNEELHNLHSSPSIIRMIK
jgi:hypothetical protein